ncbi:MAG: hypothetical protein KJ607_01440 [Bacteroidetes bacterium]|nr:hypothetical protein [Bacteroidota bacterium]
MKKVLLTSLVFALATILLLSIVKAQNIAITDDDGYVADTSAMLDVKSTTKGMLIPRVTTAQRNAISSPAEGLLVFDTDQGNFYFHNGSEWISLSSTTNSIWSKTGFNVYLAAGTDKVGVGTSAPIGKLEVKGDVDVSSDEPLFEVINSNGDTVFAVYSQGVRVYVADDPLLKAPGNRSGFAVGGFSLSKGITNEYMRITPDSVRVYIEESGSKAGAKGGFAVGGFSLSKGLTDNYLHVTDSTTDVWTDGSNGGFHVSDLAGGSANYMNLTPDNYFIGHQSGTSNISGTSNSFLGYQSGFGNTTGSYNTFLGYQSGFSNTEGQYNTFLGYRCGYMNTIGTSNVIIGKDAGYNNSNGSNNVFLGNETGLANTSGTDNIFIGQAAGRSNSTAGNNVFIGIQSGYSNQYGHSNVFLGNMVGYSNTDGNKNVFIGDRCGYSNTTGYQNIFMGDWAGVYNTTGMSNCFIGYQSGYNNINGSYNTFMGYQSGYLNSSAQYNTFLGYQCGYGNTTGSYNAFIGFQSGRDNTSGSSNVFIGFDSGRSNTEGWSNNYIGVNAGYMNTSGTNNIFIGNQAGYSNTTASGNIFMGRDCGYNNITGYGNLFMCNFAGYSNKTGSNNVALGYEALAGDTIGSSNVAVGSSAGYLNQSGQQNTYIGNAAGYGNYGSGNVFLGYQAGYQETGSNKLYIANSADTSPLLYGDFASDNVVINGHFKVTGTLYDDDGDPGTSGQVLSSTGPGTDWVDLPDGLDGSGAANQVAFWTGSGTLSSNAGLYWNNSTEKLGIGTSPGCKLHAVDSATFDDLPAVYGAHAVTDGYGVGVKGQSRWRGVEGNATSGSGNIMGVIGLAMGAGTGTRYGVYGSASGGSAAYAGFFDGDVHVNGTLSKSGGTFRIDHPQDPENKYLVHAFMESPEMKNVYDGIVMLDTEGRSTVTLPSYFGELNRDFRYQLTPVGASAPNLFIEQKTVDNQFVIAGGQPGMEVCWQVTGIRKDPWAQQHPVVVEEEKTPETKGKYLHPDLYGQPAEKAMHRNTSVK